MTDPRDRIIQEHAPILPAPNFGELAPLERPGHRYIACHDRIMIEVVRPWLRLVWPVSTQGELSPGLPYGAVDQVVSLAFKIPRELLQRFTDEARGVLPAEHAAWIVWDAREGRLKYRTVAITAAAAGRVTYDRPQLEAHESLAIDLHSHGAAPAFFSAQDDEDDAGEVKIAGVVGSLGTDPVASWAFRLCALGVYMPLPAPRAS